ncbi:MAG: hypothetical protein ACR2RV_11625 [Verrucomicrobiales bacterium]
MVYEVYKDLTELKFVSRVEQILEELGGSIRWDCEPGEGERPLITNHRDGCLSAFFEDDQVGQLTNPLADLIGGLRLTLFTLGSSHWYYSLTQGGTVLDKFDVYWNRTHREPEDQRRSAGQPELFAEHWGVPIASVEDYIVGWDPEPGDERWGAFQEVGRTFARPGDRSPYGHAWQFTDFLSSIGVPLAGVGVEGARVHAFRFPGMHIPHWDEPKRTWFGRVRDSLSRWVSIR